MTILIFGVNHEKKNIGSAITNRFKQLYGNECIGVSKGMCEPDMRSNNKSPISLLVNCIGVFGEDRTLHSLIRNNALKLVDLMYGYKDNFAKDALVLNITSSAGVRPNPEYPKYSLSKQVAELVTKQLANEYISRGVYINSIALGRTRTKMREQVVGKDYLTEVALEPSEVAEFIYGLYHTNQKIYGTTYELRK